MQMSNLHQKNNVTKKKGKIIQDLIGEENSDIYYYEKYTMPTKQLQYNDLFTSLKNLLDSKISKFDTYVQRTNIRRGALVLYSVGKASILWKPSNAEISKGSRESHVNLSELNYGHADVLDTLDGNIRIDPRQVNIPIYITCTDDFRKFANDQDLFKTYDKVYHIIKLRSVECKMFNKLYFRVIELFSDKITVYEIEQNVFNKIIVEINSIEYLYFDKKDGEYYVESLIMRNINFKNKKWEVS